VLRQLLGVRHVVPMHVLGEGVAGGANMLGDVTCTSRIQEAEEAQRLEPVHIELGHSDPAYCKTSLRRKRHAPERDSV
jgi:hypothetical protein